MTPEEREVVRLAVQIAQDAPLRQSHGYAARVPWQTINELRNALDALGVPWRKYHRQQKTPFD